MAESLLSRAEVERRAGFKKSSIYARIAADTFPVLIRDPGGQSVRWIESEVDAWISDFITRGRGRSDEAP